MPNYCRDCSCFTAGPLATCTNCGREHDRDDRALECPTNTRPRKYPRQASMLTNVGAIIGAATTPAEYGRL